MTDSSASDGSIGRLPPPGVSAIACSRALMLTKQGEETFLSYPSDFIAFGKLDVEQSQLVRESIAKLKRTDGLSSGDPNSASDLIDASSINLRLSCLVDGEPLPARNLALCHYLGHGRTGVVLSLGNGLVAKLVGLSPSSALASHPDRHERHAGGFMLTAARNEAQLFMRELAPPRDDVVPQFCGLYSIGDTSRTGFLFLVTSYAGLPLGIDCDLTYLLGSTPSTRWHGVPRFPLASTISALSMSTSLPAMPSSGTALSPSSTSRPLSLLDPRPHSPKKQWRSRTCFWTRRTRRPRRQTARHRNTPARPTLYHNS